MRRMIVLTMLLPWKPQTQEMRTIASISPIARSPASFDAPYTLVGFGVSPSTYGIGFVPSKT